jgi:2-oxo-4-hydroxy-4-carboxy--5-ureidoimidazoline (OHCU) decarboxylase
MSTIPSIEQLNRETPENFIKAVNTLFETAPPLAKRLLDARPYSSYLELIDYGEKVCLNGELSPEEKIEVMNAHPRIGASKVGLSAMSLKEQGYNDRAASNSNEDEQVNNTLARLNQVRRACVRA